MEMKLTLGIGRSSYSGLKRVEQVIGKTPTNLEAQTARDKLLAMSDMLTAQLHGGVVVMFERLAHLRPTEAEEEGQKGTRPVQTFDIEMVFDAPLEGSYSRSDAICKVTSSMDSAKLASLKPDEAASLVEPVQMALVARLRATLEANGLLAVLPPVVDGEKIEELVDLGHATARANALAHLLKKTVRDNADAEERVLTARQSLRDAVAKLSESQDAVKTVADETPGG